jgi:hypothetical protein
MVQPEVARVLLPGPQQQLHRAARGLGVPQPSGQARQAMRGQLAHVGLCRQLLQRRLPLAGVRLAQGGTELEFQRPLLVRPGLRDGAQPFEMGLTDPGRV